jgi:AraC-like DNA-binding protein
MRIAPINLKTLAYTLDVEGFDSGAALAQCGLSSTEALPEGGEWVPLALFDRLMAAAIEVTRDTSFGLQAGKSMALMKYGAITPLVLATPNLRQMLADIKRFSPLVLTRPELELVEAAKAADILVSPAVEGGLSGRFRTEMVATSTMQMLRFAGASSADIYQVAFPYRCPIEHETRYQTTFGPRLSFEQPRCQISFNPALLDAPLSTHDPLAYMSARTRVEAALTTHLAGVDMAYTVRQWLLGAFPRQPTVQETAAHLGLSERRLRRQLSMLGLSHAELALACQRMMAERLLAEGKLPLKHVAEALGFASTASFHRAFRRWSGQTPSAWREGQGAQA